MHAHMGLIQSTACLAVQQFLDPPGTLGLSWMHNMHSTSQVLSLCLHLLSPIHIWQCHAHLLDGHLSVPADTFFTRQSCLDPSKECWELHLGEIWQVRKHCVLRAAGCVRGVSRLDAGKKRLGHVEFNPCRIVARQISVQRLRSRSSKSVS